MGGLLCVSACGRAGAEGVGRGRGLSPLLRGPRAGAGLGDVLRGALPAHALDAQLPSARQLRLRVGRAQHHRGARPGPAQRPVRPALLGLPAGRRGGQGPGRQERRPQAVLPGRSVGHSLIHPSIHPYCRSVSQSGREPPRSNSHRIARAPPTPGPDRGPPRFCCCWSWCGWCWCCCQVYSSPGDSVYMFRPTDPPQPRALADCRLVGQVGPLVQEVQASSSSGISYSVRLVNGSSDGPMNRLIRLQHTVGGLAPFENLVTRLDTSLAASSYSLHENGYERRPAEYNASRSVGNNYKPFVSRAALSTPVRTAACPPRTDPWPVSAGHRPASQTPGSTTHSIIPISSTAPCCCAAVRAVTWTCT